MPGFPRNSRERMLAALECRLPDHPPCAFMMYKGLKNECRDYLHFLQAQMDLGLDTVVELPPRPPVVVSDTYNLHGLPVSHDPRVRSREWAETGKDGERLLVREYRTPGGTLRVEVLKPSTWPWGDHVPFLDDHLIPAARKPLVTGPEDLPAVRHLLCAPSEAEIETYQEESAPYLEFARANGLLVAGGWGVGADLIGWLCGLREMMTMTYRRGEFLEALLATIAGWNQARMRAAFRLPLDLYIKRAWYENCDFWTPASWRKYLLPILRREVELAHEHGAKFGYLVTSKAMPLVEGMLEAGVDVLVGVDPREWDLGALAGKSRGRMCLWGGVNGHLTVETGTEEAVRAEVREAMRALAPTGGFILSPVDNVREHSPEVVRNVRALVETWREWSPGLRKPLHPNSRQSD